MTEQKIKILLVDDHTLFRTGIKYLLEQESQFSIVGEATDGLEGIKLAQQLKPDAILLDLDMPIMNGREALPQILNTDPDMAVIILTVSEDGTDLAECMRLGARGYLLKNIDSEFLVSAIKKVVDGDSILSPEMTSKLIRQLCSPEPEVRESGLEVLTPREIEILKLLAKGSSNKIIAREYNLAESTVKVHVQNILKKLELHSRVQAAIFAVEQGLLKDEI